MIDRTTKTLLVLIAVALWGILLRPLFTPVAVRAEQSVPLTSSPASQHSASPPAVFMDKSWIYVVADGYITQYQRDGDGEMNQPGRSFPYPGKPANTK